MREIVRYWVVLVVLLLLPVSSPIMAKGKGRSGAGRTSGFSRERPGRPSGWNQGEKKGWNTDIPPGLEKKNDGFPSGLSKEERVREREIKEKKIKEEKTKRERERLFSDTEENISPEEAKEKVREELKQRLRNQDMENKSKGNVGKQE